MFKGLHDGEAFWTMAEGIDYSKYGHALKTFFSQKRFKNSNEFLKTIFRRKIVKKY